MAYQPLRGGSIILNALDFHRSRKLYVLVSGNVPRKDRKARALAPPYRNGVQYFIPKSPASRYLDIFPL